MKKFVAAIFAGMIVAMSCVTAFAAASPEANVIPNKPSSGSNVVVDNGPKSPQTGASDVLPVALVGLSTLACGAAAVMFAKTGKSE
jgi:LPXTG-motif cell wall-anchored protein